MASTIDTGHPPDSDPAGEDQPGWKSGNHKLHFQDRDPKIATPSEESTTWNPERGFHGGGLHRRAHFDGVRQECKRNESNELSCAGY